MSKVIFILQVCNWCFFSKPYALDHPKFFWNVSFVGLDLRFFFKFVYYLKLIPGIIYCFQSFSIMYAYIHIIFALSLRLFVYKQYLIPWPTTERSYISLKNLTAYIILIRPISCGYTHRKSLAERCSISGKQQYLYCNYISKQYVKMIRKVTCLYGPSY